MGQSKQTLPTRNWSSDHGTKNDVRCFRLLDLPLELRDRIYRELLSTEKARIKGRQGFSLTPAILRANKQLHAETSTILYKENTWVLLRLSFWDAGLKAHEGEISDLNSRQVAMFPGSFVLEIRLLTGIYDHFTYRAVPLPHFHLICLCLMSNHQLGLMNCDLFFHISGNWQIQLQQTLFDSLAIMRGVSSVAIQGILLPYSRRSELVSLMKSSIMHMDELFSRSRMLRDQGDHESSLGHLDVAAQLYWGGAYYPHDLHDERDGQLADWALEINGADPARFEELWRHHLQSHLSLLWCFTQKGPSGSAYHSAEAAFQTLGNFMEEGRYSGDEKVRAIFYMGLAKMTMGKDFEAVDYFGKALKAQPGHDGVNKELDAMLARNQSLPPHKKIVLKGHIDKHCRPYRQANVKQINQ